MTLRLTIRPLIHLSSLFFSPCYSVYLGLNDNQFEGPVPSEMGRLFNMTRLQMQSNSFTGTLPNALGGMEKLEQFTIESNRLSGEVPLELCHLLQEGNLNQFVVDCYSQRERIGFDCEPDCCTLCRDVQ